MIKGLSERRRLPRAGKIKLGYVVERGGKTFPRASDHFVVPDHIKEFVGDQPKELSIVFPSDQIDGPNGIFTQEYKMYRATGGLFCAGNGEQAKRWGPEGRLIVRDCPCEHLESGQCGPKATLSFFLPNVPGIGVYQITTQSVGSIVSINSGLEMFARMFGGLQGVPFVLKLEEQVTQRYDEKSKEMVKTTVHILRLDSRLSLNDLIQNRRALGAHVEPLMLPEPDDEDEVIYATSGSGQGEAPGALSQPLPEQQGVLPSAEQEAAKGDAGSGPGGQTEAVPGLRPEVPVLRDGSGSSGSTAQGDGGKPAVQAGKPRGPATGTRKVRSGVRQLPPDQGAQAPTAGVAPTTTKGEKIDPGTGEIAFNEVQEREHARNECVKLSWALGIKEADAAVVFSENTLDQLLEWVQLLQEARTSEIKKKTCLELMRASYRQKMKNKTQTVVLHGRAVAPATPPPAEQPPARVDPEAAGEPDEVPL